MAQKSKIHAAWSVTFLLILAILYIDDLDLMHRTCSPHVTSEEFIVEVQQAINYWGKLVQATSGTLKPDTSFAFVMDFKFSNGKVVMKKVSKLPPSGLTIPQPDGPNVAILILEVTEGKKTLGVVGCPAGSTANGHLDLMVDKANAGLPVSKQVKCILWMAEYVSMLNCTCQSVGVLFHSPLI